MSSIPAPEELASGKSPQDVYWLEQREVDVPASNDWLSTEEAAFLARQRFAKRRADWRLGRWTAKQAITTWLNLSHDFPLASIEIRAAFSGAPEIFLSDQPAPVSISLSHSSGVALCALAFHKTTTAENRLGCDVETIEPRSDAFVGDYFTASEQALIQQTLGERRPLLTTLLWSAKESALKALRQGLRLDTRSVEISLGPAFEQQKDCWRVSCRAPRAWHPLQARYGNSSAFHGWWGHDDQFVRTIVSRPPSRPPIHVLGIGTSESLYLQLQLMIPAIRS